MITTDVTAVSPEIVQVRVSDEKYAMEQQLSVLEASNPELMAKVLHHMTWCVRNRVTHRDLVMMGAYKAYHGAA